MGAKSGRLQQLLGWLRQEASCGRCVDSTMKHSLELLCSRVGNEFVVVWKVSKVWKARQSLVQHGWSTAVPQGRDEGGHCSGEFCSRAAVCLQCWSVHGLIWLIPCVYKLCSYWGQQGGFLWLFGMFGGAFVWEVKVKNFVPCWCVASIIIVSHCSVSLHRFLQVGHWPVTGYTHVLQGSTVYYCSAM